MTMTSKRDPYPFPKLESDDNFVGARQSQMPPYSVPPHISQSQDPWNRLNHKATLSSQRREAHYYDPQAPSDSLDFVLKSTYDHHDRFLYDKPKTLTQPETTGLPHGRILKNRIKYVPPPFDPMDPPLRVCDADKKEPVHSNKGGAIESHHSAATNQGYSRKHDGGFYTI
ncbi:protein CFAP276-like [Branchiostoma lanceolatum]|uniref:C1orf194 protein n=1 Tax=Branchiostoma lanceolatum TaxID=7740 RepID=A0A8J9ZYF6_BRALA|nr:C1orf194 [Branchiostoma lanceolatum]